MLLADYEAYIKCQEKVSETYAVSGMPSRQWRIQDLQTGAWTRRRGGGVGRGLERGQSSMSMSTVDFYSTSLHPLLMC